jgi:hypothetical protein
MAVKRLAKVLLTLISGKVLGLESGTNDKEGRFKRGHRRLGAPRRQKLLSVEGGKTEYSKLALNVEAYRV